MITHTRTCIFALKREREREKERSRGRERARDIERRERERERDRERENLLGNNVHMVGHTWGAGRSPMTGIASPFVCGETNSRL